MFLSKCVKDFSTTNMIFYVADIEKREHFSSPTADRWIESHAQNGENASDSLHSNFTNFYCHEVPCRTSSSSKYCQRSFVSTLFSNENKFQVEVVIFVVLQERLQI